MFRSRSERLADGKRVRSRLPREDQAHWPPPEQRRDPLAILEQSNLGRLEHLTPIRYGRMLHSPFTFLRGSAALMAADLASLPNTGLQVQACGDCHLLNFGFFATPERHLVFDLNDFDETHPAPWEWDLKRLAVSFVVAARDNNCSESDAKDAAIACVGAYREHLREYSRMSPLEVWYARLEMEDIIAAAPDAKSMALRRELAKKAEQRIAENLFPKVVSVVAGQPRFVDQPPLLYHLKEANAEAMMRDGLEAYRQSLSEERRTLLDRYTLVDFAQKVVGIGSVGTRCYVLLLLSEENHPLILQAKEARRSVLEPYTQPSRYDNQGERVVMGQRLMQSSSDIFLGWVRGQRGYDNYVRQLRDMKLSIPVEEVSAVQLKRYAQYCGWSLARAHAKSGDGATISGYLGKANRFDDALGSFAISYADQNEQDHAAFVKAGRQGRIEVLQEDAF
ncbi:MAG: DUF2252 domain-containing protein [Cyanobium sp.]